jgi:hypothetical protein
MSTLYTAGAIVLVYLIMLDGKTLSEAIEVALKIYGILTLIGIIIICILEVYIRLES